MKKNEPGFLELRGLVDIEALAASLAAAGDAEQGAFFNVFFEALRLDCGDEYRYQMQLTYIGGKLKPKAIDGCLFLGTK